MMILWVYCLNMVVMLRVNISKLKMKIASKCAARRRVALQKKLRST